MAAFRQHRLLGPGVHAPEFRLQRLGGGEASLSELIASGPVVLAFFKTTCPVCQLTFPFLERLHKGGKLPIYAVSQDGEEDTLEFNRHFGVTFPALLDTEDSGYPVSDAYGISSVPTIFVVGPDGRISDAIEGWSRNDMESLGEMAGVQVIRKEDNVPALKAG
jgi:peroxiredoxin